MPVPTFNESIKAEKLPMEVFRWLKEASIHVRTNPESLEETYDTFKLLLRLLAVRNPESQSHAIRQALGSLVESICLLSDSETITLDLLALFIRMVDAKKLHRYNPMKHLAIAGLGYLSRYLSSHMRQMSANVFIISLDSLSICPSGIETQRYRNTLLWAMTQSATSALSEATLKQACKTARSYIESTRSVEANTETKRLAFEVLAALISQPAAKVLEDKFDSFHHMALKHGFSSLHKAVRIASAEFFSVAIIALSPRELEQDMKMVVAAIQKLKESKTYGADPITGAKIDGYSLLLMNLLKNRDVIATFDTQFESWMAPLILQLNPFLSKKLLIDGVLNQRLNSGYTEVEMIAVFLRQLALSRVKVGTSGAKSKIKPNPLAMTESILACLTSIVHALDSSAQAYFTSIHQANLGLILSGSEPLSDEQLAWSVLCLVEVVRSHPALLVTSIQECLAQLEIPAQMRRRTEIAYFLSVMIIESKNQPLYGDLDLNRRVFLLGCEKIKEKADFVSFKVGWLLISATLCLGPEVVKPLLHPLLLLWESHLSDEAFESPESVERALSAMVVFLEHNHTLLTSDVSSRLSENLYKLWFHVEGIKECSANLRLRMLQCYDLLIESDRLSKFPSGLIMKYVSLFSEPTYSALKLDSKCDFKLPSPGPMPKVSDDPLDTQCMSTLFIFEWGNAIGSGLLSLGEDSRCRMSNDLDHIVFSIEKSRKEEFTPKLAPRDVHTRIINLSIRLTARLLHSQPVNIQESVLNLILTHLENAFDCSSPRKMAVTINVAYFVLDLLKDGFTSDGRILNIIISLINQLLGHRYDLVREQSAKCCGILAGKLEVSADSTNTLGSLIKQLLNSSISSESPPLTRNGSILALGYIALARPFPTFYDALFKILMVLAADPDPRIYLPVIISLNRSLSTAEFIDPKYIRYALKTITMTYLLESHGNDIVFERELAYGLTQVLSRLGPILATDQQKSNRDLIICFADQLQTSSDVHVRVNAWKSYIEVYYFSRQSVVWPELIRKWRDIVINLQSPEEEVDTAINGLLLLTRISAHSIISIAGNGFRNALWLLMDKRPSHIQLRSLLMCWLDQTGEKITEVSSWLQILSDVVMRPRRFFLDRMRKRALDPNQKPLSGDQLNKASTIPTAVAADEDVVIDIQTDEGDNNQFSWEARKFALDMLLHLVRRDLDGKDRDKKSSSPITAMVGDIIRISFTSSTSQICGLQFGGLSLLEEIIAKLSDVADPDFPHLSLLAQYQVQIISALSPAFGVDSSPDLAMAALRVCATLFTSEIINSREKPIKLIKIFEESLLSIESKSFVLGNLELSANAARVLKVATLALWAQIFNSSKTQPHLADIVKSHPTLPELWTEALYDFEKRESAFASHWSSVALPEAVEQMTGTQSRLLMEPVCEASWLSFVRALSVANSDSGVSLVLGGLCFQSLTKMLNSVKNTSSKSMTSMKIPSNLSVTSHQKSVNHLNSAQEDMGMTNRLTVLEVLIIVLTEEAYQQVIHTEDHYFDEMISILYRAMLLGKPSEQVAILKIANSLVRGQPETDDSVDHFFELLKISIVPLKQMFPQLFDHNAGHPELPLHKISSEQIDLLRYTMDTVIDIAQVFREVIQIDLWICLLKVFEELNHFEPILVAPSFKRLLEVLATQVESRGITFVVGALTLSLKKAVEQESKVASLLVSAAIVCTNSRSLFSPIALSYIKQFGARTSEALLHGIEADADDSCRSLALIAIKCATAVFRTCADNPAGSAFAYSCIPSLVMLTSNSELLNQDFGMSIVKQAAAALSIYAALDGTFETYAVILPALLSIGQLSIRNLLLQLAVKNPAAFKSSVWKMEVEDREYLQGILAQNDEHQNSLESPALHDESDDDNNKIELKSFA